MQDIQITVAGDKAVYVVFGESICPEIQGKIRAFCYCIEMQKPLGILEIIPAYCSVMVCYEPKIVSFQALIAFLKQTAGAVETLKLPPEIVTVIPVLYGGDMGEDLDYVASYHNKTIDAVIEIHTREEYLIYMLGFTPGFPYLGGMSKEIATPRLSVPRIKIPAGSVGIAGEQTGIYPIPSPGGWQLIGQTPVKLYDPESSTPILLKAGHYVRFASITKEQFVEIKTQADKGQYLCKTYRKEAK